MKDRPAAGVHPLPPQDACYSSALLGPSAEELENRRFERVKLARPIEARVGTVVVSVIDVSLVGLQVHHQDALPPRDQACVIAFSWNGAPLRIECRTVWTTVHRRARNDAERNTLSTGLRVDSAPAAFTTMIAQLLAGDAFDPAVRPRFLVCELEAGSWKQARSTRREQPAEGFTIAVDEDATQIARLCSAYANGDAETRRLIRTLAALSINRGEPS